MRIVHFSTFDCSGGAARSAYRLHKGLQEIGVSSTMVVRDKKSDDETVYPVKATPSFWARKSRELVEKWYVRKNRAAISNTYFSLFRSSIELLWPSKVHEADVLHFHWVTEFLELEPMEQVLRLGKPVVWTLHDQRPFTGGCHFTAGCSRFIESCSPCAQLRHDPCRIPHLQLKRQLDCYGGNRIRIVSPTTWLAERAKASRMFKDAQIEIIPYGLDATAFQPMGKASSRSALSLPEEGTIALFVADNAREKRKGFQQLVEALELCANTNAIRKDAFTLACAGHAHPSQHQAIPFRTVPTGYLSSDLQMAQLYSAADFFILPSLEDNLPNTALEAMSCGTPVVAFASGGIPEVVRNSETGKLAASGDVASLAKAIAEAANNPSQLACMARNCRQSIVDRHSQRLQAERYAELYESLLATGAQLTGSSTVDRTKRPTHHSLRQCDGG